ncbi:hypothetical protein CFIMG_007470RA00001 [Ceratocystis fimbriata CBS 114723]|uniref:Uncharacterized protein n=1 Tax=Ceratocystis fimbriata CBS 114723 TaxID=1035309 RepID=A0A2C5XEZ1_9PEZI|nr:hypothetical protein CFIMG_007470RA00001 [Ceratocystis fimbriata CBS 114723]
MQKRICTFLPTVTLSTKRLWGLRVPCVNEPINALVVENCWLVDVQVVSEEHLDVDTWIVGRHGRGLGAFGFGNSALMSPSVVL